MCSKNAFSRNETEYVSTQQNFKERNKHPLITRLSQNKTSKKCTEHNMLCNSFPNDTNGHMLLFATENSLSGNFRVGGNQIRYSLKFLSTRNFMLLDQQFPKGKNPTFQLCTFRHWLISGSREHIPVRFNDFWGDPLS